MKKKKEYKKPYIRNNSLYMLLILLATAFLCVGYCAVSDVQLLITGIASSQTYKGLVITSVNYSSSVGANLSNCSINDYYKTMLDTSIELGNDSSSTITYEITIMNRGNATESFVETLYDSVAYSNNEIEFYLTGMDPGTVIRPNKSKTFTITFKYADGASLSNNSLDSYLNFKFEPIDAITTWDTGTNVSNAMKALANGNKSNVKHIVRATDEQYADATNSLPTSRFTVVSLTDSVLPTTMWYDSNTLYYYTEADTVYLNADSKNLFYAFNKVEDIDTTPFDVSQVTDMYGLFYGCQKLKSLDLRNWNTSRVENMYGVFYNLNELTYLNISGWDTSRVKNMASMFGNLRALDSLVLTNFNTELVTDMSNMFNGSTGLTTLDVSSFNTRSNKNFSRMFASIDNVTTLDMSNFNAGKATNMVKMFSNAVGLKTVYVSSSWSIPSGANGSDMFINCPELVGGAGFTFDANKVDKTYAVINTEDVEGYFTLKPSE